MSYFGIKIFVINILVRISIAQAQQQQPRNFSTGLQ